MGKNRIKRFSRHKYDNGGQVPPPFLRGSQSENAYKDIMDRKQPVPVSNESFFDINVEPRRYNTFDKVLDRLFGDTDIYHTPEVNTAKTFFNEWYKGRDPNLLDNKNIDNIPYILDNIDYKSTRGQSRGFPGAVLYGKDDFYSDDYKDSKEATILHELLHATQANKNKTVNRQLNKILGNFNSLDYDSELYDEYKSNLNEEIYSRLMESRFKIFGDKPNFDANYKFTPEDLNTYERELYRLRKFFPKDDDGNTVLRLLNEVAQNDFRDNRDNSVQMGAFGGTINNNDMKRNIRRKKLALGLESPLDALAQNDKWNAEAMAQVESNGLYDALEFANQMGGQIGGAAFAGSKGRNKKEQVNNFKAKDEQDAYNQLNSVLESSHVPFQFAGGGRVFRDNRDFRDFRNILGFGGIPVEVEGGETAETPFGQLMQFNGPNHEQGGIDVDLPQGTEVFSKRIKIDNMTLADRKKKREKKLSRIEKMFKKNPTDILLKNSLNRTTQVTEREEELDKELQKAIRELMQWNAGYMGQGTRNKENAGGFRGFGFNGDSGETSSLNNLNGLNEMQRFDYGGGLDDSDPFGYMQKQQEESLMNFLKANDNGRLYNKVIQNIVQPQEALGTNGTLGDYGEMAVSGSVGDGELSKRDIRKANRLENRQQKANQFQDKSWQQNLGYMPSVGDAVGIFGNLFSAVAPYKNTLANRGGDLPNENSYRNFGENSLRTLSDMQGLLEQNRSRQMSDLTLARNSAVNRGRNSAMGVNTMRAMDLANDMNLNRAANQVDTAYNQQLAQLMGQTAHMQGVQDQFRMTGEAQKLEADKADRDAYYTQLSKDLANMGQGFAHTGKSLNQIQERGMTGSTLNSMYNNVGMNPMWGNFYGKQGQGTSALDQFAGFDANKGYLQMGIKQEQWDAMDNNQRNLAYLNYLLNGYPSVKKAYGGMVFGEQNDLGTFGTLGTTGRRMKKKKTDMIYRAAYGLDGNEWTKAAYNNSNSEEDKKKNAEYLANLLVNAMNPGIAADNTRVVIPMNIDNRTPIQRELAKNPPVQQNATIGATSQRSISNQKMKDLMMEERQKPTVSNFIGDFLQTPMALLTDPFHPLQMQNTVNRWNEERIEDKIAGRNYTNSRPLNEAMSTAAGWLAADMGYEGLKAVPYVGQNLKYLEKGIEEAIGKGLSYLGQGANYLKDEAVSYIRYRNYPKVMRAQPSWMNENPILSINEKGFVEGLTPKNNFFFNTTTDQKVTSHNFGQWYHDDVFMINPKALKGSKIVSVNPTDQMFLNESIPTNIRPKDITLISGNPKSINAYENMGFKVKTNMKLKKIYRDAIEKSHKLFQDYSESYNNATGWGKKLMKPPNTNIKEIWGEYEKIQNSLIKRRPTIGNYNSLREKTGLNPHVEKYNNDKEWWLNYVKNNKSFDDLQEAAAINSYPDGTPLPIVREDRKPLKSLNYKHVFYNPTSSFEYEMINQYNKSIQNTNFKPLTKHPMRTAFDGDVESYNNVMRWLGERIKDYQYGGNVGNKKFNRK